MEQSRRQFLGTAATLAAAAAVRNAYAQAPAQPGVISNEAIKAGKAPAMTFHSERPLTGSVPAHEHNFEITPSDRMFVRNNLLTPDIDAARHTLTVKGLVGKELTFSVDSLRNAFPALSMQGMLECAGSGRSAYRPNASGTPWAETGGMGCPKWTGVRLRDVLNAAGVQEKGAHVAGQGGDPGPIATAAPVIRSIPLEKAMDEYTLIAWAMNDAPLPKVHGYPLRLVVPGWVGSASTKWLHTITVLEAPFKGTYMDSSYRIPRWPIEPGQKMPPDAISTEAWPVKSMITSPAPNARFKGGSRIVVSGRAWVGQGEIDHVEVSTDEGRSWQRARLGPAGDPYAWRTFSYEFEPERFGHHTILARAWDDRNNVQPAVPYWNPLGYFWNGWHRVGVLVEA